MKITDILIPSTFHDNGLADIKMERLGNIVLLVGKNGAGKTRLFTKIREAIREKPGLSKLKESQKKTDELKVKIKKYKKVIEGFKTKIKITEEIPDALKEKIAVYEKELIKAEMQLQKVHEILNWNLLTTDSYADAYVIESYVPTLTDLADAADYTINDLAIVSNRINTLGVEHLESGVFAKIQQIQNSWFNTTHPEAKLNVDKQPYIDDYKNLKKIIQDFLKTELNRDIHGKATLFGLPLGETKLSDGQKIILQLVVAIFSQQIFLKNIIIFLDEPDNHLHPSAIIETIENLRKIAENSQIWISTHNIALLAHFNSASIYYVENNDISFTGAAPEKVLAGLFGDDKERENLQDFVNLPAQYALVRFAYECLFPSEAVITGIEDPQMRQIYEELLKKNKTRKSKKEKMKILDYGAGKGRLLSFIAHQQSPESVLKDIEYVGYDENITDKELCESTINSVFGNSKKLYFNNYQDLCSVFPEESFDVVVMCNVLHEIDPNDWLMYFGGNGIITPLLKNDGILLIVEDQLMPHGEKAYKNGFIVLNTYQLRLLFDIPTSENNLFSWSDAGTKERIKAHIIPKRFLSNINSCNRHKALESVKNMAAQDIRYTRLGKPDFKAGRKHAFYVQQFANASLALEELGGNPCL